MESYLTMNSFLSNIFSIKKKGRDVILTGVPRSGTTLSCLLLSNVPNSIALNEAANFGHVQSAEDVMTVVEKFFKDTRKSLVQKSQAIARATEEGLSDNNFSSQKSREKIVTKRMVQFDRKFSNDCTIILKHNAIFTMMAKPLLAKYEYYAIIRNPASILGSWNSVDVPVSRGRVRRSRQLNPSFHAGLNDLDNKGDKQLFILDWYFKTYGQLPIQNVIKYEDIISTGGAALNCILKDTGKYATTLKSRNTSRLYNKSTNKELFQKLLDSDNSCWNFYSKEEVFKTLNNFQ